ncbi:MAG: response regulator [Bacteroidota bacterium]
MYKLSAAFFPKNRIFYLCGVLLAMLISTSMHGQEGALTKEDSARIYTIRDQAFSLRSTNPDSALLLMDQAFELLENANQSESDKSVFDNEIRRQRNLRLYMGIFFMVVLIAFFTGFRFYRYKKSNEFEQVRLNEQLNQQKLLLEQREKEQLKEMNEFKTRFLTDISHEFRTALTIISGTVDQIDEKPEQWLRSGLKMIRENTQKLILLTNQLLELKYMEANASNISQNKEVNNQVSLTLTKEEPLLITDALPGNVDEKIVENGEEDKDKPRLLIVEDNYDMVEVLIANLEDDYEIYATYDGAEGIEKAIAEVPDLIVSDVMMPEKNGYELCDALKQDERTNHIPIILLTAKADVESRLTGLQKGADAYLAKPFEPRELLIRLEKLLELRQLLQGKYNSLEPIEEEMTAEDTFIMKLRSVIEENISDQDFGIPELCQAMGISRSPLHNKIKALTGISTSHFVRSVRLNKAKDLLEKSEMNISQVAYEVGFKHPRYFSEVYHKQYKVWPSQVKKK